MVTPTSRIAYRPYYEILDRALDSKVGIRVPKEGFEERGDAMQLRVRLHKARTYDRQLNRESRDPVDPFFGISDYDGLIVLVRLEAGRWYVHVKHNSLGGHEVEELSA